MVVEVEVAEAAREPGFAAPPAGKAHPIDGRGPIDISSYPGRLIVIESTDGAGRSTHISLLREWLESHGFGVTHTALKRSRLAAEGLAKAKEGHTLGRTTMDLFYATDFADRLENFILPSLRAGFVVLTDRYIYSSIARAIVRSADPLWIRDVYRFAPAPHATFYLKVDLEHLLPRVLARGGFDYWESGMDFQEETDIYNSYVRYQKRILSVFDELAQQYGMKAIDANGTIREVFEQLKGGVREVVSTMRGARV